MDIKVDKMADLTWQSENEVDGCDDNQEMDTQSISTLTS